MSIDQVREWISGSSSITVLTGAGISTGSGIADFRGPQGVWTKDPEAEKLSTLDEYLSSPDIRRRAWQSRLHSPIWNATPNAGHRSIVDLERQGKLNTLITQNIDGLHHAAGSDPARIVEIHGTAHRCVCWTCSKEWPMAEILSRVEDGEEDPPCREPTPGGTECGGIIKSSTISFGQNLVPEDIERSEAAALSCDLLMAIGSSLAVHPAAGLVPLAARAGAIVIIVNEQATPYDPIADAVLRGSISETLPAVTAAK